MSPGYTGSVNNVVRILETSVRLTLVRTKFMPRERPVHGAAMRQSIFDSKPTELRPQFLHRGNPIHSTNQPTNQPDDVNKPNEGKI